MSETSNDTWWQRGAFYSLYIDKFANDIPGLISKLPYFKELGIDCLHLLPFYPSPMTDGGFDITDHTGVRPELGTVDDFKRLCSEAKKIDIKIMVDLVLNHTSNEHPWFVEARSSKDNPKRDFYMWSDTGTEYPNAPNVFPDFKEKNWLWNEATGDYFYATFKPTQPDLNWQNPAVREAMFRVLDTLVGYGVSGFRLDAIMHLVEKEGTDSLGTPETHECIAAVRTHLNTHHPHVILLAEALAPTQESKTYLGAGNECHLSYNQDIMNEMYYHLRTGNERGHLVKKVEEAAQELPPNTSWMCYLRNHDSLSLNSLDNGRKAELLDLLDPNREHMFSHGSDTVQRLYNLLDCNDALVRQAFDLFYSLPFATVTYYGDELGMRNTVLPPGENDMRYTVRGQFDWQEAESQMADPTSLWHHTKKCLAKK